MSAEASQQQRAETNGQSKLGQRLRAERERRGTKLVKIAAETRVGVHYLAALEHSDYDELPGEVFTKGYVRAYAEFLGLDADEMTDLYLGETVDRRAAEAIADDETMVREMSRVLQVAPDRSHRLLWSAVVTVLLLLTVAVGWWLLAEPDSEQPSVAKQSPTSDAAASTTVDTTPNTRSSDPKQVETAPLDSKTTDAVAVVSEFGVGRQVIDRNLIGRGDRFEEGAEVWFWTRILGAEPGTILQHVWLHDGAEISRTSLNIGASHWRTQSRKTLFPGSAGNWAVEVRDQAGNMLARAEFFCDAPA